MSAVDDLELKLAQVRVKAYTRKTKSGKVVSVKSFLRAGDIVEGLSHTPGTGGWQRGTFVKQQGNYVTVAHPGGNRTYDLSMGERVRGVVSGVNPFDKFWEQGHKGEDAGGYGYLGERQNADAKKVAEADKLVQEHAKANNWSEDQLFKWANSKMGRHFADVVLHGGGTTSEGFAEAKKFGLLGDPDAYQRASDKRWAKAERRRVSSARLEKSDSEAADWAKRVARTKAATDRLR